MQRKARRHAQSKDPLPLRHSADLKRSFFRDLRLDDLDAQFKNSLQSRRRS